MAYPEAAATPLEIAVALYAASASPVVAADACEVTKAADTLGIEDAKAS